MPFDQIYDLPDIQTISSDRPEASIILEMFINSLSNMTQIITKHLNLQTVTVFCD